VMCKAVDCIHLVVERILRTSLMIKYGNTTSRSHEFF
jgi:hypothetical protein